MGGTQGRGPAETLGDVQTVLEAVASGLREELRTTGLVDSPSDPKGEDGRASIARLRRIRRLADECLESFASAGLERGPGSYEPSTSNPALVLTGPGGDFRTAYAPADLGLGGRLDARA